MAERAIDGDLPQTILYPPVRWNEAAATNPWPDVLAALMLDPSTPPPT
jgi:hypothetical protein